MERGLLIFMSLFAAMNPLASTPVFLSLTKQMSDLEKKQVAKNSIIYSFILGAVFFVSGKLILSLFGITIPAFQIGGGIIVFSIGLDMLRKEKDAEGDTVPGDVGIAISPLAVPLIIGPGGIATIINLSSSGSWAEVATDFLIFGVLLLIMYGCFLSGKKIVKYLGEQGLMAVTKIMGLILAIIGTQMVINGVEILFKIALTMV
ncbi:inner membrane protein [Erysipelotrichaceae bacterium]|nr:inner membrane protein [Erysipelotrichaceae bacterium]